MVKRQRSIQFIRSRSTHFQYADILDAAAELVHVLNRFPNAQFALAQMVRESLLYQEAMASIKERAEVVASIEAREETTNEKGSA